MGMLYLQMHFKHSFADRLVRWLRIGLPWERWRVRAIGVRAGGAGGQNAQNLGNKETIKDGIKKYIRQKYKKEHLKV